MTEERRGRHSKEIMKGQYIADSTYSTANLRGLSDNTGNKKKHIIKQTAAPKLHAPNMSMRSHRLTRQSLC